MNSTAGREVLNGKLFITFSEYLVKGFVVRMNCTLEYWWY